MPITDFQFANWLRRDSSAKVWLVEIDYVWAVESPPGTWTTHTGTLYFGTAPYLKGQESGLTFSPYLDVVKDISAFGRTLDRKTLGGAGSRSFGSITLENQDSELDFLLDRAIDGSEVRVYLGDASWARTDFRQIFKALSLRANAPATDRIEIPLADFSSFLNASIEIDTIGGTGPNSERISPLNFGFCRNVELILEDDADILYRAGQSGVTVLAVRDDGLSVGDDKQATIPNSTNIDAATDTITATAHGYINEDIVQVASTSDILPNVPAGLSEGFYFVRNKTANTFQLSTTRTGSVVNITSGSWTNGDLTITRVNYAPDGNGRVRLAHPPGGTPTADITNSASPYTYDPAGNDAERAARDVPASSIIEDIIDNYSNTNVTNGGAHTSYGDTADDIFYLGLRVEEKQNLTDVLSRLVTDALAFWSIDRTGAFKYGRIWPTALAGTSVMDFTLDDAKGPVKVTHADPLYWRLNWVYNKNWKVQDPGVLSPVLTAEEIAYYSSKGAYASGQIRGTEILPGLDRNRYHLVTTESPERETLLSNVVHNPALPDALDSADQWYYYWMQIYEPYLEFVEITVGFDAYDLDLGDVVTFQCGSTAIADRYGMVAGTKFQVAGVTLHPIDLTVDLVLVRNRPANLSETI